MDSESAENAKKARTDALAADLLDIDQKELKKAAKTISGVIEGLGPSRKKIVIAGGAGSGKTTLGVALSKDLEIPVFDLDEFIKGGWTENAAEYKKRFQKALIALWPKLPSKGSWIIEHVEACSPDIMRTLQPNFRILVHPPDSRLISTANARTMVSNDGSDRVGRALSSAKTSKKQFKESGGYLLKKGPDWTLMGDPRG